VGANRAAWRGDVQQGHEPAAPARRRARSCCARRGMASTDLCPSFTRPWDSRKGTARSRRSSRSGDVSKCSRSPRTSFYGQDPPARGPEGPRSRGQARLTEGDLSAEPALVLLIRPRQRRHPEGRHRNRSRHDSRGAPEQSSVDGTGANARFTRPSEIAGDGAGHLYVTEWSPARTNGNPL
jgi:hypothetical protein